MQMEQRKTFLFAHRGGASLGPENTLKAIRRALMEGVDGIEVDVRESRDNALLAMHDSRIERTTGGIGAIEELTLDEVREFDAGDGEQVPTIDEVVDVVCANNVELLLDVKPSPNASGMALRLLDVVTERRCLETTVFSSSQRSTLKGIKRHSPSARVGIIVSFRSPLLFAGTFSGFDTLSIRAGAALLSPVAIKRAHRDGARVLVWFGRFSPQWLMRLSMYLGADGLIAGDVIKARRVVR
jgi:glycerophosphoryl diester phosphodiesterase